MAGYCGWQTKSIFITFDSSGADASADGAGNTEVRKGAAAVLADNAEIIWTQGATFNGDITVALSIGAGVNASEGDLTMRLSFTRLAQFARSSDTGN